MRVKKILVIILVTIIMSFNVLAEEISINDTIPEQDNELLEDETSKEDTSNEVEEDEIIKEDTDSEVLENNDVKDVQTNENESVSDNENELEESTIKQEGTTEDTTATISYSSHVQDIGWQKKVNSGEVSGTTGKSLRLEALKINLNTQLEGGIEYSAHVQNIGWQDFVKNDELSGTTGKSLRLEAIKIRLYGRISEIYDIYYRVHIENFGWMGWTKNGENAGSQRLALRLEAIEIKLLPKDDTSIEVNGDSFAIKDAKITYQAHVQNIGNQYEVGENDIAGTTGKSLRLEALKINLDSNIEGGIEYKSYIERRGWESTITTNGNYTGTMRESKQMQLIKINLTGELANKYDIYYRVHSEVYGWLDWAKNGETAGVNHYSIEAIQIRLYLKNDKSKNYLPTKTHYIENVSYKPVHYLQKDSRWGNQWYGRYQFGKTGCAPTSMAMAFTGILGRSVLPPDIGSFLYNNSSEFNKKAAGSSGQAILLATRQYNIKETPLKNKNEIENALKNGKIVYAAMGNGKYGRPTYNHAIIFYSYNNARTIVYDPLSLYEQSESIDLLWNEQSKDPDDYSGGSNFYSLERY